jgi:UDP-N-acetylmuramoyl-tripeptide--D-alanyl-D-alanine ligase
MFKIDELLKATKGRLVRGRKDTAIKGISIDSRTISPKEAFIAIKGNNFDGHDFIHEAIRKKAKAVILESPRHHVTTSPRDICLIQVKDTIKALGDIAKFQRHKFNIPVIAVTGSNGKTTVKEMIAWVLAGKFKVLKNPGTKNNNIGLPLALINLDNTYDIAVLEIGTNHFGEVRNLAKIAQPNIGIITNIGHSHLEYFKDLKGVFREKYTLIENLQPPNLAILNVDDVWLRREALKKTKKPVILTFSSKNKSDFFASDIKYYANKLTFLVNAKLKMTLKTLGRFNIYNALVAVSVARLFGMEYKDISERLSSFRFPRSRLNFIELNNLRFIDDSYNSNPFSLKNALEALENFKTKGRKIFVMGDMLELGDSKRLFHWEAGYQVSKICDAFIAVGELSGLTAQTARKSGLDIRNIFSCQTSCEARDILLNKISPTSDDIILVKGSRGMKMENVLEA